MMLFVLWMQIKKVAEYVSVDSGWETVIIILDEYVIVVKAKRTCVIPKEMIG